MLDQPDAPPEVLPEGYYLENFHYLLNFVATRYETILERAERQYASDFRDLPSTAQMLYVRLIQRKGPLFRLDKLVYAEVPDVKATIACLSASGFVDRALDAGIAEKLRLLTRTELLLLPLAASIPRGLKKAEIIDQLELLAPPGFELDYDIVQPLHRDHLQVYKLLFFGNLQQDFTEFVLNDLGVTPFESYPLNPEAAYFDERWLVNETLKLYALNEQCHQIVADSVPEQMKLFTSQIPVRYDNDRLARRFDRIVNRLARQFERLEDMDQALLLYNLTENSPSRERRARILSKQNRTQDCEALCMEILGNPRDDHEQEFAQTFLHRLHKTNRRGAALSPKFSPVVTQIGVTPEPDKRIEEVACRWFRDHGCDAVYVENSLLPGLFGLAFWDIIFMPVKSAFFNPFQRGPADLFTSEFRENRANEIAQRMLALRKPGYLQSIVFRHFSEKYLKANHFVNWNALNESLLARYLDEVALEPLLSVFQRLLADPRNNRSGFPDLVVFKPDECVLVEVKGPGDRLQQNQLRWLRYFETVGIASEVAHLHFVQ